MGWPTGGFYDGLGEKSGELVDSGVGSFLNCHFKSMHRQKLLKYPLNSGLFILFELVQNQAFSLQPLILYNWEPYYLK